MNWSALATLAILAGTIHWLVARAEITRPFWSAIWLPTFIDSLLRCPACSGFWLGLGFGAVGLHPVSTGIWWIDMALTAVIGVWTTPLGEAVLLWALGRTKIH